ncbi:hypothetical protein SNEBB_006548 [Seison nebaliae]|nr:hypothetical protein SNEBB_006548 [Seison nebaliae]
MNRDPTGIRYVINYISNQFDNSNTTEQQLHLEVGDDHEYKITKLILDDYRSISLISSDCPNIALINTSFAKSCNLTIPRIKEERIVEILVNGNGDIFENITLTESEPPELQSIDQNTDHYFHESILNDTYDLISLSVYQNHTIQLTITFVVDGPIIENKNWFLKSSVRNAVSDVFETNLLAHYARKSYYLNINKYNCGYMYYVASKLSMNKPIFDIIISTNRDTETDFCSKLPFPTIHFPKVAETKYQEVADYVTMTGKIYHEVFLILQVLLVTSLICIVLLVYINVHTSSAGYITFERYEIVDYFVFTQLWPPVFCVDEPCRISHLIDYWTIHGLWPSNSNLTNENNLEYCGNSPWNASELKEIKNELKDYWPDIFSNSTTKLWKHEWLKHGTCAQNITSLNSIEKFFRKTIQLSTEHNMTKLLEDHSIHPSENDTYTIDEIERALLSNYANETFHFYCFIYEKEQYLSTIELCLDRSLNESIVCPSEHSNDQQTGLNQFLRLANEFNANSDRSIIWEKSMNQYSTTDTNIVDNQPCIKKYPIIYLPFTYSPLNDMNNEDIIIFT